MLLFVQREHISNVTAEVGAVILVPRPGMRQAAQQPGGELLFLFQGQGLVSSDILSEPIQKLLCVCHSDCRDSSGVPIINLTYRRISVYRFQPAQS